MPKGIEYNELAKAKVQEKRNIVISEVKSGVSRFTVAQQLEVEEGNRRTSVFMKGAFHVENLEGLYNLRDALNVAITAVEASKDPNDDWDN